MVQTRAVQETIVQLLDLDAKKNFTEHKKLKDVEKMRSTSYSYMAEIFSLLTD